MDPKADKARFVKALAVLCAGMQVPYDEKTERAWLVMLADVPIEEWERISMLAPRKLETFGSKLPPLPKLLALIGRTEVGASTLDDDAEEAAGKAIAAAGRFGHYETVAFDDPAIHLAIEGIGGWPTFCRAETTPFERKVFTRSYVAARRQIEREGLGRVPLRLYGEHGVPTGKGVGDFEKIKAWQAKARDEADRLRLAGHADTVRIEGRR